jgi:hypothetical protein
MLVANWARPMLGLGHECDGLGPSPEKCLMPQLGLSSSGMEISFGPATISHHVHKTCFNDPNSERNQDDDISVLLTSVALSVLRFAAASRLQHMRFFSLL